jgi:hypothetical protein
MKCTDLSCPSPVNYPNITTINRKTLSFVILFYLLIIYVGNSTQDFSSFSTNKSLTTAELCKINVKFFCKKRFFVSPIVGRKSKRLVCYLNFVMDNGIADTSLKDKNGDTDICATQWKMDSSIDRVNGNPVILIHSQSRSKVQSNFMLCIQTFP